MFIQNSNGFNRIRPDGCLTSSWTIEDCVKYLSKKEAAEAEVEAAVAEAVKVAAEAGMSSDTLGSHRWHALRLRRWGHFCIIALGPFALQHTFASVPKLPSGSHRPKQQLGQSYLTDPNTINKIVESFHEACKLRMEEMGPATASNTASVLELGPGLGALTRFLAELFPASKLLAVDIDPRAVERLRTDMPELQVRLQDLLTLNHSEVKLQMGSAPLFVVANLPYSITTDALISLVKHPGAIRYAQVMVQREAAERIVATVGSKDYSVLSVMLQAFCHVKQLYLVPPTAFYPPPKVVSSIVELDFKENSENIDVKTLLEVVKESFRQRKRALKHSLKAYLQQRRLPLPLPWSKLRAEQVNQQQGSKMMPDRDFRRASMPASFGAQDKPPLQTTLVTRDDIDVREEYRPAKVMPLQRSVKWASMPHGMNEMIDMPGLYEPPSCPDRLDDYDEA
eukprot:symbB.v1.2.009664.t1/scaffold593.1/size185935/15